MANVEFVSYDGHYPNLCSGKLVLKIKGKIVEFPDYCMTSSGQVSFDSDWNAYIEYGPWHVTRIPTDYVKFSTEIDQCVNNHVPFGCCGGCI